MTNAQGRYLIINVPTGEVVVRATLLGYGAQQQAVSVQAGQTAVADLTLTYNKARQASITKELLDIVGGAEALKG